MSKYLEYLVLKDIQSGERSRTTKGNITLAYKYKAYKAYFFYKNLLTLPSIFGIIDIKKGDQKCIK